MANRTFFKTPDGGIYSVSDKVISVGFEPSEGVRYATDEEIEEYNRQQEISLTNRNKLSKLKELRDNNILSDSSYESLIKKIEEQKEKEKKAKQEAADILAKEIKEQKRLAKEAAIEAQREAVRQAAYEKRQEVLRIRLEEEQAAAEAERIATLKAERKAAKEAERQAALEAERLAAEEASKPRKFSAA